VVSLGSFEEKACRFVFSLVVLVLMVQVIPALGNYIGLNAILGYLLGVIYIKDRYGRYHYTLDGRFVSSEEAFCLECILPLIGIAIPAAITWFSLPMYAIHELLVATFGSEIIGIIGGFGLFE